MSLQGRTIALAEGRQLEDLAQMIEKEGGVVLRCPMLQIVDQPDAAPVVAWLRRLVAGEFTHVVLLTGEGLRRLLGVAEREGCRDQAVTALSQARIITRGPKPVRALKEVGLAPAQNAVAPTTEGVIAAMKSESLATARVGVQLYSEANLPLTEYLQSAGAAVYPVSPYIYARASGDAGELIQKMAAGQVDALVFTSAPQVERLFELSDELKQRDLLVRGLQRVQVAAVGPIVKEKLLEMNVPVAIMPEQGFVMKNLVQRLKRAFSQ
jgi:uroporphyrinogen-III synthase